MQLDINDLLGPFGLVVGALIAVGFLARELFKFIREYIANLLLANTSLKADLSRKDEQLEAALDLLKGQTDANRVLADAQSARNRDDELRHRLEDVKRGAEG